MTEAPNAIMHTFLQKFPLARHRLSLFLWLMIIAMHASAESDTFTVGDFTYKTIGNEQVSVQARSKYISGDVIIPRSVEYEHKHYDVTLISEEAFCDCADITSLSIPGSINSIKKRAFSGCIGITLLSVPDGVKYIGDEAFFGCTGIVSVSIPATVGTIDLSAFSGCTGMRSVSISEGVQSIGAGAFFGCAELTAVSIPTSVTSIGGNAFSGCIGLTSVSIPASVTSIESSAFSGCIGLTSVSIPAGVTAIESGAFSSCTGLTSVSIPAGVMSIGADAFRGCIGLTSVSIPAGVTSIGNSAFSGCTGLTSVSIPASVTEIGSSAFSDCTKLTSVSIPASLTTIGSWAFSGCTGLSSVSIPAGVTSIGSSAFYRCAGLKSIDVDAGNAKYTSVDGVVYNKEMTRLIALPAGKKRFDIPNSITSIESGMFSGYTNLTTLSIPSSVSYIGPQAFSGCTSLISINVDARNAEYTSIDGALYNKDATVLVAWPGGVKECHLPSSVTSIGWSAFSGCTGLTSVSVPATVTSIGINAFRGCTGLTSVSIPASVTSIEGNAFSGCTGLASISIPASITSISRGMFSGCTGLTSVSIPTSVTSIGSWAFSGCTALRPLILPESVTKLGSSCFSGCNLHPLKILSKDLIQIEFPFTGMDLTSEIVCYHINYDSFRSKWAGVIYQIDEPELVFNNAEVYYTGVSFDYGNPYYEGTLPDVKYYAAIPEAGISSVPVLTNANNFISGLNVAENYTLEIYKYNANFEKSVVETFPFATKRLIIRNVDYNATQTTLRVDSIDVSVGDRTCVPKITVGGREYKGEPLLFTGLRPMQQLQVGAEVNGCLVTSSICTKDIDVSMSATLYPDAIEGEGGYDLGDATLAGVEWILSDRIVATSPKATIIGLVPEKEYEVTFRVNVACEDDVMYSKFKTAKVITPALELEMQTPRSAGNGKMLVSAKTNLSESEENVGFEWKKTDAPATLPYSTGYSAIYNGYVEGLIQGLQNAYYDVRAFYKDANEHYYYTDIISFDPTDFSYFKPTVHTYPAESDGKQATLRGYALGGTDNIVSQGFQYWIVSSGEQRVARHKTSASTSGVMTVEADGQRMTAVIRDLKPGVTYAYRAYVETTSDFAYGEELTFDTPGQAGVDDVTDGDIPATIVGYFDINGRRYNVPQRGLNIVVYSNGRSRKMICK